MNRSFLESLTFLDDERRRLLEAEKLTEPEAFKHVSAADLRVLGIPIGDASRLIDAAKQAGEKSAAAGLRERVCQALRAEDLQRLHELGVGHVIMGGTLATQVDLPRTLALYDHVVAGGSVPRVWQGKPVQALAALVAGVVLCSPVAPFDELQAGRDPKSGVEWAKLGEDGLKVAAHGYKEGFFRGMSDLIVLGVMLGENASYPGLRESVEQHYEANAYRGGGCGGSEPATPLVLKGSPLAQLAALFVMFDNGELSRLLGEEYSGSLPPAHTTAEVEFRYQAAALLQRRGEVKRASFWDSVAAVRPRRRAEIAAVADLFGVKL